VTAGHLVQILLPVADNQGRPFPGDLYGRVRRELTERFGGLTAFTRAPAEGLWKDEADRTQRDAIVVFEVMAPDPLDEGWWSTYRSELERVFQQEAIIVRAHPISLL
jgi:hypothetical protein